MEATPPRLVRLLADITTPAGVVPAGQTIVVDAAEARVLLGAIGLAEDLGEAPDDAPATTDVGAEGRAVANPGGSVPQAPDATASAEASTAIAAAGDDTLPGAAPGDGDTATDVAPVSDAPAPRAGRKAKA